MEARGRSRTPSRLGSGSLLGEQLFAQKIEQKLQRHNALLEARLHRSATGEVPRPQSAHSSNAPGSHSEASSVSGRGMITNRPENSNRPRSADLGERNGFLSSQQRNPQSGKSARGQKERISEYAGQIRSGGAVAGMFDPKYASRESLESARNKQSKNYQERRINESVSRTSEVSRRKSIEGRERMPSRGREKAESVSRKRWEQKGRTSSEFRERNEEYPGWLFADSASSRRGSMSGDAAKHLDGKVGSSGQARSEDWREGTTDGGESSRRISEARRGNGIRTLSLQGSLEEKQGSAARQPEPRGSRGADIEVLRERMSSGSAEPSERPKGSSWPSEVAQNILASDSLAEELAQRETQLYEQLYRPLSGSLSIQKKQGFEIRTAEPQASLGRTSSKLEQLLMQVERDGLQQDDTWQQNTGQIKKQELHNYDYLDSPQGGFRGERRSQPYEEEPKLRAQHLDAPVESTGQFFSLSGGSGLTDLLNRGFLSEGLEDVRNRRAVDADTEGSTAMPRADSLESALASVIGGGQDVPKSKVSREGSVPGAASTSHPSSARSASDSPEERAQTAAELRHVATSERPASASNASRRAQDGSSHVVASPLHRPSSDGQKKLERSSSGRSLDRNASKSGVFRIASPLQRETSTGTEPERSEDVERRTSGEAGATTLAEVVAENPRPERPAFLPDKNLQRARSTSPRARRRMEDRFEAEAKERTRRLQKRVQEQQEEREARELAECTFAPTISTKSKELFDSGSRIDFLERIRSWQARRDARIEEEKAKRERRELKECTFQPAVTRYESPLRERPVASESAARGGFWRSEWDGLPARTPNWEGSLRDGGTHYALEQQKHGSLQTTRDRSTSAPPLRPWSALGRTAPQNLGVRFDYGLSRLGFEPESRPASALSTARGVGFSTAGFSPRSEVSSEVRAKPNGLEAHDLSDVYSVASQRAQTEWEARHYERMMSARRHSMDLRRLLNQFNGSSWRYALTRPQEPNLSDKEHVRVRALEQPISPLSYAYS